MSSAARRSPPRLRAEVRPVRLDRGTILFLGGPETARATGPTVERLIAPWLESLRDGTVEEFVRRLDSGDSARFDDLLAVLGRAGLLAESGGGPTETVDASAAFLDRFGALAAESRPAEAWTEAMRRGLVLDCPAELRDRLAEMLPAAAVPVVENSRGASGHHRMSASFEVRVGSWRLLAGLYRGDGDEPALFSARLVPEWHGRAGGALSSGRPEPPDVGSLGAAAALVAHWVVVATAGLPTIGASSFHGDGGAVLSRGGGSAPGTALEARTPVQWQAKGGPDLEHSYVAEICRYAVGIQFVGGRPRRIAPSAGGFGVTQAICLVRGSDPSGPLSALAADGASGRLHKFLDVPRGPLEEILGPLAHETYVLLVAAAGTLRARYGVLAERLTRHDAGVAMDHVARAAETLARGCVEFGVLTSNCVLQPLRLPYKDPGLIACAWVGFDAARDPSPPSPAAVLEAMVRRRSVRAFSKRLPGFALIRSVEREMRVRRATRRWREEPATAVRLYRILKEPDGGFSIGQVATGTNQSHANEIEMRRRPVDPRRFIRQAELADSVLLYVLGYPARCSDLEPSRVAAPRRWVEAGEILSAVWLEAHARGLAGTLYGRVEVGEVDLGDATIPAEICLCLGFPR